VVETHTVEGDKERSRQRGEGRDQIKGKEGGEQVYGKGEGK
jgi:hypothetical protein